MKMREFSLAYGSGTIDFSVKEENILHIIESKDIPGLTDIQGAITTALEKPIDSAPLKEIVKQNDRVVILVSDITRMWIFTSIFLPHIVSTVNACGVPDKNIKIIVATGQHRPNTEEEMRFIVGEDIYDRITVENHDAFNFEHTVYMGKTSRGHEVYINKDVVEADRLIVTGGIIYHFMAGYGGGRKSIIPGVSHISTIQQNHLLSLLPELGEGFSPNVGPRKVEGNPQHHDSMEIASLVKPDFIFNIVPNTGGEYAGIFAGNWTSAWQKGCELADRVLGIEIKEEADIVVCSAVPADMNLYQTGKAINNAYYAVKEGGAAIILSECKDINEPPEFTQWFKYDDDLEFEKALRDNFTIPGAVAFGEKVYGKKARFIIVTRPENEGMIKKVGMTAVDTIEKALDLAYEYSGQNPSITVMPKGALTFPVLRGQ